jgi:hypothetical protein
MDLFSILNDSSGIALAEDLGHGSARLLLVGS